MKPISRTALVFLHDILAACGAWLGAYALRFNLTLPPEFTDDLLRTLAWVVPLQTLIFWRFGLYRGLWRFASVPDLARILRAVAIAALAVPGVLLLLRVDERMQSRRLTPEEDWMRLSQMASQVLAGKKLESHIAQWKQEIPVELRVSGQEMAKRIGL